MLKIFRRVRQKLLSDNRFSKYLLYAVGEIVLVMIGILLALQVNNWNEDRKNYARLQGYKKSLIEDLVQDTIDISEALQFIREDNQEIAEFERRIELSEHPLDTLYTIARNEYNHYIVGQGDFNDDTFQILSSTGDIALFDQEIINALTDLSNLKEFALYGDDFTWDIVLGHYLEYSRTYPVRIEHSFVQSGSKVDKILREEVSLKEHASLFNALVSAKKNAYRVYLDVLPRIVKKSNTLLDKLREQ